MERGLASENVTVLVLLLSTVLVVALASKYIRVPYTVLLVVAGLLIAVSPIDVSLNLTPDVILFIFLPALLFESAYNLSFAEVRENLRPIALLAVPGVILTAAFVAVSIHYVVGIEWVTALLFGAIMSATDPVSVLAIFKRLGAPRRLATILEGESLFNDGTALVLFSIVLDIVLRKQIGNPLADLLASAGTFAFVVIGALALGALLGYSVSLLMSRVDDYLIETAVTLVTAYAAYLVAEQVGVSGVIAVVVAGIVLGNFGRSTAMSPTTRLSVSSSWEFFGFIANSLIFLLIGLELTVDRFRLYVVPTALAIASVLAVRTVVVMGSSWVLRYIHKPLPYRWQGVLIWGGLRGSLALAMALSLPFNVPGGAPFPDRDLLQVMTFGVILFSLLVQGLTMGKLMETLGISRVQEWRAEFEELGVRRAMVLAALDEIDTLSATGAYAPQAMEKLREAYAIQIADVEAALRDLHLREEDLARENLRSAHRRIIQVEKTVVHSRYRDGMLSEETMRNLLSDLDAQLHALDEGRDVSVAGEPEGDTNEAVAGSGERVGLGQTAR